jgi:hypothetical protein
MATIVERMRNARKIELPVEDGVTLILTRPSEVDTFRIIRRGMADERFWLRHVIDWRGVTEEIIEGKGVGNTTPVPFDDEVRDDWLQHQKLEWIGKVAERLMQAIDEHWSAKVATQGNSMPS